MFHDRSLLGRCCRGFVLPVLEYCSAVWCSAADTHLKLLDRALSGARFLTGGVFECDISHRRPVAVLCMLYKIRNLAVQQDFFIPFSVSLWNDLANPVFDGVGLVGFKSRVNSSLLG